MPHHIKPSIVANQLCDHPVLPRLCIHSALVTPIYWGKASDTALFFQFLFGSLECLFTIGSAFLGSEKCKPFCICTVAFCQFPFNAPIQQFYDPY